ncbi:uncharacterized protein KD926_008584 [Aspergillus affinis]|uniref:uncharacterized protein n=1 Tax=Aspergillus affinis TaxID=1070780 RepID=UPI0022FEA6CB|nr:uncharacterized protein KD926_008584 [Aspergillus affinis]KAI9040140.1 hypothetical protein KD926_008584 [Aspergillus affinis]
MGADSNPTRGVLGIPLTWREKFRYSNLPNKSKRKYSLWKDVLLLRKLLGLGKTEEGSDWIKGVVICTCITGLILAINIILAITATVIAYRQQTNRGQFQMAELYNGQCSRSSHWATGLHAVINVLSTMLLGASNYVMQSLGAPSRTDIDQAHAKSRWLDIGTSSFRNFTVMDIRRKILWALLLISSTPIHLIYNSVIFSSLGTLQYSSFVIPDDLSPTESLIDDDATAREAFLSKVGSDAAVVQAKIFNEGFINTTIADCLAKYNVEFNTKYGTLIFVANRRYFDYNSSLKIRSFNNYDSIYELFNQTRQPPGLNFPMSTEYWSYRVWNYSVSDPIDYEGGRWSDYYFYSFNFRDRLQLEDVDSAKLRDIRTLADYNKAYNPYRDALREYLDTPSHWVNSSWATDVTFELIGHDTFLSFGESISMSDIGTTHCLIEKAEQRCLLSFSPPIAIAVIICNATKFVCMLLTARAKRQDLMLTVGDALASFLTRPDLTTRGRCFLSVAEMTRGPQAWSLPAVTLDRWKGYTLQQQTPSPTSHPLDNLSMTSTSAVPELHPSLLPHRKGWYQAASWRLWTMVLFLFISCIATTIYFIARSIASTINSSGYAMGLDFGQISGNNMIDNLSTNMIALVLLVNTPQLVLSTLYFLTNSILTCMLVAAEWDRYAQHRRPLRVSWPRGQQRSTYYLSLPYRYSIPLLILSATVHWLLSQSIFFVNIKAYRVDGEEDEGRSSRGCCYSPIAIVITLSVVILAMGLLLGLGTRQFKSHMPLATHCSAAISAACHPPEEDEGAALKPVIWGEIPREEGEQITEYTGAGTGDGSEYAHCSFTSLDVVEPILGRMYC